jgi:hypothetical protein
VRRCVARTEAKPPIPARRDWRALSRVTNRSFTGKPGPACACTHADRQANRLTSPALLAIDLDGTILHCPEGVSVFPDGHPAAPRLALLGSQRAGMARNKIKIVIDGMDVTVG